MTNLVRTALVARPVAVMFDLVNDVASYPQHFDWCVASQVEVESSDVLRCQLQLKYKGIRTEFTTRNAIARPTQIAMQLIDGPFSTLEGQWAFEAIGDAGCRVALQLNFDFAGKWIGSALALGFQSLADKMVDDFVRVARSLPSDVRAHLGLQTMASTHGNVTDGVSANTLTSAALKISTARDRS